MDTKQWLLNLLNEQGYTDKHVTVAVRKGRFSVTLTATIRDTQVNYKNIEECLRTLQATDCRHSDVPLGGNIYTKVKYAETVADVWAKKYSQTIESIVATLTSQKGDCGHKTPDDRFSLFLNNLRISVWDRISKGWVYGTFSPDETREIAITLYIASQD